MECEKYSESLTRAFVTLDKDIDEKKTARQKVKVLLSRTKTADTKLIACKAIISHNYASDFPVACYHLSAQIARLHGVFRLEEQRYKQCISEASHNRGGWGGGRVHGFWMRGVRDGARRGRQDGRGVRRGGWSQTMINGVELLDPICNFKANY